MNPPLDPGQIALGIRQPWAELILSGQKTIELRRQSTRVRGRIYIYAARTLATEQFAQTAISTFNLNPDTLPRGLIVGTVEIHRCRPAIQEDEKVACVEGLTLTNYQAWELAHPQRFEPPQPIQQQPYGIWFYPFRPVR